MSPEFTMRLHPNILIVAKLIAVPSQVQPQTLQIASPAIVRAVLISSAGAPGSLVANSLELSSCENPASALIEGVQLRND